MGYTMKKLIFTFILISFYFSVNGQQSESKAKQYVYFFLDCSCFCQPETGMDYERYHIITDTIYVADIDSMEVITEQFRDFLKENYTNYGQLLPNLIIRYYNTEEQALTAWKQKISKMSSREYIIIKERFIPKRTAAKLVQNE